jgi:hypothetical protein
VRYTYPGVLNGRDIKQREATRKYKKQKKKATKRTTTEATEAINATKGKCIIL